MVHINCDAVRVAQLLRAWAEKKFPEHEIEVNPSYHIPSLKGDNNILVGNHRLVDLSRAREVWGMDHGILRQYQVVGTSNTDYLPE